MAHDDKTEKPTPKRKKEARKKGQVPKSPDVSAWMIMLAGSVIVPDLFRSASKELTALVGSSTAAMANPSPAAALAIMQKGLGDVVALVLPVVAAFMVVGVVGNVAQTGLVLSSHGLKPKWERLNPLAGVKRLFSAQSLWQLGKQVMKLVALVGIAYGTVSGMEHKLVGSSPVGMGPIVVYTGNRLISLTREVAVIGLLLAVGDYAWQRRQIGKQLKMTKQQVKDEARQSDGDPHAKAAIRKKQYQLSRSRIMAAVAGANVIVVNPTHFAVAIRYDTERGGTPVVVAKGMDELALRIRDKGKELKVPVVEDPPLARAIYAACDVDQAIPPELFLAVARLLAFVFSLSPIVKAAGLVHRRPASALVA